MTSYQLLLVSMVTACNSSGAHWTYHSLNSLFPAQGSHSRGGIHRKHNAQIEGEQRPLALLSLQAPYLLPSPKRLPQALPPAQEPASKSSHTHHVGNAASVGWIQHDYLSGDVALHRLGHLVHCAVDGRVIDLEPIVSIPPDEEPDVLLPKEPLLVHLSAEEESGWVFISFLCLISHNTIQPLQIQRKADHWKE